MLKICYSILLLLAINTYCTKNAEAENIESAISGNKGVTSLAIVTDDEKTQEDVVYWERKTNVNKYHDWTIRFNHRLKDYTINSDNIYVLYNGKKVSGIQVTLSSLYENK